MCAVPGHRTEHGIGRRQSLVFREMETRTYGAKANMVVCGRRMHATQELLCSGVCQVKLM